jgi:rsbT co-antagonist protein RsbR
MSLALPSFLAPTSVDSHLARRQFALHVMVAGLVLLAVVWLAVDLASQLVAGTLVAMWPDRMPIYVGIGVGLLISLGTYSLSRRGRIELAGYLFISVVLAFAAWITWYQGIESGGMVLYFLFIAMAGLLMGGRGSFVAATVAWLVYSGTGLVQQLARQPVPLPSPLSPNLVGFGLVLYLVAALNWIANRDLGAALEDAQQQAAELRTVREEQALLLADLRTQTEQQARLLHTVEDLAAPVIVIHDQIIALPLVGHVDSHRAERIRQTLLAGIARHRAGIALIDLTGMPRIDPDTVHYLEAMCRAGRLLGAEVVLVGIHAEAAAEIVRGGTDLRGVETRRNLQAGIEWALARMGKRIVIDG